MFDIIFHQVFWTFTSLILFYILMSKFVLNKVGAFIESRNNIMEDMAKEIECAKEDIKKMNDEIFYIENDELPKKFISYIKINTELFEEELEIKLHNAKEEYKKLLQEENKGIANIDFNSINIVAKELVEQVQ